MRALPKHGIQDTVLSVVFLAGWLASAQDAQAVILYSSDTRNTAPPLAAQGLDGWNLQAQWGSFLATPITSQYFITAKHAGIFPEITFRSQTYQVNTTFNGGKGFADDDGSDLRVFRITGNFPAYAPLYTPADGDETGKTITIFGRGTQRGAAVTVSGDLRGWQWGAADHLMSWGQDTVDGISSYRSGSPTSLLYFYFNGNGTPNEGALSTGDSSGGAFIEVNGVWKLAGVNYAVSNTTFKSGNSETDSAFRASVFDSRGLYVPGSSLWEQVPPNQSWPDPSFSEVSRISDRLAWIESVPEPGSLMMLASVAPLLLLVGWRARRRMIATAD